jgi:MFS transporter, FSR family, fosmidomycin resistance protein
VTRGVERRALVVLSAAHGWADFLQGAVPALIPFLVVERGLSYGTAGGLLLASSLGAAAAQPLFGLASDRREVAWLMPAGLLVGAVGLALAGVAQSGTATAGAIVLSGVGVAAFHPEAARHTTHASGGRPATGMGLFAFGGNAGFALGPALTAPAILLAGLPGTVLAALPVALAAAALATQLPRLRALRPPPADAGAGAAAGASDDWPAFRRLATVVGLRSAVFSGLQAFVPLYFVAELGTSQAAGAGALEVMLVAGAVGTVAGGVLADRMGRRRLLVQSLALLGPLLAAFALAGRWPAVALLGAVGVVAISTFGATVLLGQEYLPSRLGLASGITLGAAIGVGGVAAVALGVVADHAGLPAALWVLALLPVPALALARRLPPTAGEGQCGAAAAA